MRLLLSIIVFGMHAAVSQAQGLKVGDKAVGFSLKNVDGKTVSLKDYSNGVIVIFTCNTCPYSQAYEQRIIELHQKFAGQGYPVVAINPNDPVKQPGDSFDKMVERAKDMKYPFPYLWDESQEIATQYGATRTPHVYLLTRNADDFTVAYIGAIDDNVETPLAARNRYVEDAITALRAGKTPAVPFTKAIGCTIKWKKAS